MTATGRYHLVDGYLRNIPVGTKAEDILATLVPKEYITINSGGKSVSGAVGTGMTVDFAPGGKVAQTAVIVVTGDVNGDGKVTMSDMLQIRSHILGRSEMKGAYLQASDLNNDGKISMSDFLQTLSVVLGRSELQPN